MDYAALVPGVTPEQQQQLEALARVFRDWNAKINLVSRKDIEALETHHVLHSLAIARAVSFPDRCRVLDVGTGGGLPGLPLAILYPRASFFLCDSVAKKVAAVKDMASSLGLANVQVVHKRAEELESRWDFVLGRAVVALPEFFGWIAKNLRPGPLDAVERGVLYLKGTLFREELAAVGVEPWKVYHLADWFPDPYFQEKFVVHVRAADVIRATGARPSR